MMLTRTRRCPELAEIPAFMPVHEFTLRRVERLFERRSFDAGEVVIDEGGPGDEVFVISSGHAVVSRCWGTIATLGPGDWFGELAVLLDVPDLWRRIAAMLAQRLRQADLASAS